MGNFSLFYPLYKFLCVHIQIFSDPAGGLGLEPEVKEDSVAREEESSVSCKVLPGEDSEVCPINKPHYSDLIKAHCLFLLC